MNQTRQGIKMEHAPGGNSTMHPGMQPGMQPTGMGGQVCSPLGISNSVYIHCLNSISLVIVE